MPWPGAAVAEECEEAGASAFCSGEFADANAYVAAAEMAHASSAAMIGPGIAYAFARSPFVHASAARHLNRIAPGRVFLGLGSGTTRMNRDWFGVDSSHPAARMAELVEVIRAFLRAENDEKVTYSGDFYSIDARVRAPVLGRIDVPILIGAFNVHMLRTVGRTADGILGHPLLTDRWWDEVVDREIQTGATKAGRDASGLLRWGWVTTAVDDADPKRAVEEAKRQIAFDMTVKAYDPLIALHGWQDDVASIRTEFANGDPRAIGKHVTDEMLWSIAVCGDSAQAKEMLASRRRLPDTGFFSPPGYLVSQRRRAHYRAEATRFLGEAIAGHP
ncbi:LLM class flavin-dependent oxidoreductase [Mycobacterium sp. RTGN4]|uniref:LLM class flavin-dependent oxidoreductase n=1 Tax=unclassified Mycobacterium TaxID=2642494 RepID=UPI0039AEFAB3